MMIHEKIMSGQFLLDIKNEHSMALHHHLPAHHGLSMAPNASAASKLDLYSAYAYQQQLQQQLLIGGPAAAAAAAALHQQQQQQALASPFNTQQTAEVLDLSRRCDSVETPRKTPSPYHSTSSFGGSPATSPTSNAHQNHQQQQQQQQQPQIPVNLLYSAQQQLPPSLASLYPGLYYGAAGAAVKQEPQSSAVTTLSPATSPQQKSMPVPVPAVAAASNLLQTFAASFNNASPEPTAAPNTIAASETPCSPPQQQSVIPTTPTSSTSASSAAAALAALDPKSTRPFKAFPRDPLVIAANFAATDVLLDNPRVERYTEYRKRVLEQIRCSNGGSRTVTNPKMRRTNSRSASVNEGSCSGSNQNSGGEESSDCDSNAGNFDKIMTTSGSSTASSNESGNTNAANNNSGSQQKDAAYYERRRKNNAAAKKSRDRRRIKEDEIAIRAAYLERQNIELLCQIDALKAQLAAFTASKVGA